MGEDAEEARMDSTKCIVHRSGALLVGALAMAGCSSTDDGSVASGATRGSQDPTQPVAAGSAAPTPTPAPSPKPRAKVGDFVYIASNDPADNAILAFKRDDNGRLMPCGRYSTRGKGIANPTQRLGPNDHDQEIILGPDRKQLYTVNPGSDTIAVFDVDKKSGALTHIEGSPFSSGGHNPVSLGIHDRTLFVVNAASDETTAPTYVTFRLDARGSISAAPLCRQSISIGANPSQALPSPSGRLLFGADFLSEMAKPPQGSLRVYQVSSESLLSNAPGSPMSVPPSADPKTMPPAALGLAVHPKENLLYVGFPTYSQLGVYRYEASGQLSLERRVPNSGKAICWLLLNRSATRLYTVNTATASVSVYDTSDPAAPNETQALTLKDSILGPPFVDGMGMTQTYTSQPFQEALAPDEQNLYVISQRATTNATDPNGNVLHTLDVATDGSIAEPAETIDLGTLGVPPIARPHGVVVY
jgi:hypothetical protein